uniref:Xth1 n=1 Tax=Arundo donax TaxID=35708 RepID=A0A0A9FVJ0_ARUDO
MSFIWMLNSPKRYVSLELKPPPPECWSRLTIATCWPEASYARMLPSVVNFSYSQESAEAACMSASAKARAAR